MFVGLFVGVFVCLFVGVLGCLFVCLFVCFTGAVFFCMVVCFGVFCGVFVCLLGECLVFFCKRDCVILLRFSLQNKYNFHTLQS